MDIYLTEDIVIKNNITYYQDKNKLKKVSNGNWHNILDQLGWSKIPLPWVKRLNKLSPTYAKNSPFGVLDCESDGDCFFHCIATALNNHSSMNINKDFDIKTSSDIRQIIAESITEDNFIIIMNYYKIMKDAGDFQENWDPYKINSLSEFQTELKTSGHNYWCDYILLNEIIKVLKLNIFILTNNDYEKDYSIYNTLIDYNCEYDSIFILFENDCHFKLIGYFDGGKILSYFTENIPIELMRLYNLR